jgi:TolB-like protein
MALGDTRVYLFGDWSLDTGLRELRRSGEIVPIEPKPFDLLQFLIENRDGAIGKSALQDAIWPDVVVAESSLTRCVMKMRRALLDDADQPELIKTIPRHGYRFIADVVESSSPERSDAALEHSKPTIAILPFENMSNDASNDYLSHGMAEDLTTMLSGVPGFFVIARNSSFSYKGDIPDIRQVGVDLGARYVVEGSVRKIGDRLRINVQLIETHDGAHLWADIYDRPLSEIFDVQDEVTKGIAAALGNELYKAEFARARASDEKTLDAWGLVARAMGNYHSGFRRKPLLEGIRLCREAINHAPEFARAYSLLAINLAMLVVNDWSDDNSADTKEAFNCGRLAMQLDSEDVWVVYQWGAVNAYLGKHERAIGILELALDINDQFVPALAQMSRALIGAGRAEEALTHIAKAFQLSPRDLNSFTLHLYQARAYLQLARYGDAAAAAQRSLNINSSWNFAWFIFAVICMTLDKIDEAREALETARELQPNITREQYNRRLEFAAGGDPEQSEFFQNLLKQCWSDTSSPQG